MPLRVAITGRALSGWPRQQLGRGARRWQQLNRGEGQPGAPPAARPLSTGLGTESQLISAAQRVFGRADFNTKPTAGTVEYHNGHLFVCTDTPPDSWPANPADSLELLPESLQAAVAAANFASGGGAAAADWQLQLTLCETPSHAAPLDLLAFPHYSRFRLGPALPALPPLQPEAAALAAELEPAARATVELAIAVDPWHP